MRRDSSANDWSAHPAAADVWGALLQTDLQARERDRPGHGRFELRLFILSEAKREQTAAARVRSYVFPARQLTVYGVWD